MCVCVFVCLQCMCVFVMDEHIQSLDEDLAADVCTRNGYMDFFFYTSEPKRLLSICVCDAVRSIKTREMCL